MRHLRYHPGMSTVTFDTLEGAAKLRAAGFDEKQAEAVVRVLAQAQDGVVTREHFDAKVANLRTDMDAKFAVVDAKMDKLSWMLGAVLALAAANFAKQFF
jgi:hypothetical protein